MRIEILGSALQDLFAGKAFYDSQAEGLGQYFLDSLFSDIDSLRLYAGIHPVHFERYRRMLSRRFPFAAYYRVEGEAVVIHAILDCRRDPSLHGKRLGS